MAIKKLDWDSEFFSQNVGLMDKFSLKGLKKFAFVYYYQSADITKNLGELAKNNFKLVNIEIVLEKRRVNGKLSNSVTQAVSPNLEKIFQISKSIFKTSRFYNDALVPKQLVEKMYRLWVKKCFSSTEYVNFIIGPEKEPKAFVSYRKAKNAVVLELIGVEKKSMGKGLGSELLQSSLAELNKLCIVKTQLSNIPALNFYTSNGFRIKKAEFVFHYHAKI